MLILLPKKLLFILNRVSESGQDLLIYAIQIMIMFVMQDNYRWRYLVTVDKEQSIVNVYKKEKCIFEDALLLIEPIKLLSVFIVESCICPKTEVWADRDNSDFDGETILPGSDDIGYKQSLSMRYDNEYIFTSGFEIINFSKDDKI